MDKLALCQLNGDEDEDEALRRALAMSMDDSAELPGGMSILRSLACQKTVMSSSAILIQPYLVHSLC